MEIIKSAMIELRPRLRCCNVFLTTTHLVTQDQLIITVRPDCLIFYYNKNRVTSTPKQIPLRKYSTSSCESFSESDDETHDYSEFMNIKPYCKLVPGSLTNLKIENNSVSFRVLSEPIGPNCTGSFYTEVLNGNHLTNDQHPNEDMKLNVNVQKDVPVVMHCSNCLNVISKQEGGSAFTRILELPSEYMDMSDWFCHAPGGSCGHQPKNESIKSTNYNKFTPTDSEIFYGVSYFIVNTLILNDAILNFNKKRDYIYCNRCLSHLGSKCEKYSGVKFWNASVDFSTDKEKKSFKMFSSTSIDKFKDNLALFDVVNIINRSIKDSLLGVQIPTACKIILQTEESKKQYLFLWILDRHLELLKSICSPDPSSGDSMSKIQVTSIKAAKVLYMVSRDPEMLNSEEWNNSSVQVVNVSKKMLIAMLTYLTDNSKCIPETFKKTSSYYLSYIFL